MARIDQAILAGDGTFQNRVTASLLSASVSISNEGWTVPFHRERATFAAAILSGGPQGAYMTAFANSVATDATVIADATNSGAITLTTTNRSTAASQVTDAHIDNAISSQFNSYLRLPGA